MKSCPITKNKEYIVDIIDYGYEGEGIAKIENFTIFIPSAIKGETIKVLIVKVLTSHAFGKIVEIIKKSENRIEPDCNKYSRCGGCNLRHIEYEETLNIKQKNVQNLINKYLKTDINVEQTIAMGNPYNYRNKLQYPVGLDKSGNPSVGVFANRTHEIISIDECLIQDKQCNQVAQYMFELIKKYKISIYDETKKQGLIRHIIVKRGFITGEIMTIFVINGESLPFEQELTSDLKSKYQDIKSIVININKKDTNVILGEKNINILGNGYIKDILGDYVFKISPLSFYQVNPVQAEAMYNYAIEKAKPSKEDIVFDLYCGIGTISIFFAKHVKKVFGVEIVPQAIEMAKENAKINGIENTVFLTGDTEKVLTELIQKRKIKPDIIIVDPPRRGLDKTTIKNINDMKSKKVIYISCNPASLVRDLSLLEQNYEIKSIQPFEMFPWTSHIENIAILKLR